MELSQPCSRARRFVRRSLPALALLSSLPCAASAQTYVFGRADFPTGINPAAAVVADFNGDGKPDLAAANQGANTISILLGKADGTFASKMDFATGLSPISLIAADFNGDGKSDLAVADFANLAISIHLGNGDGTFQSGLTFPTRNPPHRLIAADFNHDGKLDIATVNSTLVTGAAHSSVSILLGNGVGTFTPFVDYPMDGATLSIASGDFNGDGHLDLAIGNIGLGVVSILLGSGDGRFAAPVNYDFGIGNFVSTDLVAGNFNGLGNLDLAACGGGNVSILLANRNGTFQAPVIYTGLGPDDGRLTADDFNGDGKLDLAVSNGFDGGPPVPTVCILLGKGDGTFQAPVNYNTGGQLFSVTSADLNGDGKPDLAMVTAASTVAVLIGKGDGTFSPSADYPAGAVPMSVTTGDFDGDGKPDLVTANRADDTLSVFLANGDGTFQPPTSYSGGSSARAVIAADLNGDGKDDLIVAGSDLHAHIPTLPDDWIDFRSHCEQRRYVPGPRFSSLERIPCFGCGRRLQWRWEDRSGRG
jgi:hypothetical protein